MKLFEKITITSLAAIITVLVGILTVIEKSLAIAEKVSASEKPNYVVEDTVRTAAGNIEVSGITRKASHTK